MNTNTTMAGDDDKPESRDANRGTEEGEQDGDGGTGAGQAKADRGRRKGIVTRALKKLRRVITEGDAALVRGQLEKLKAAFDNFESSHDRYNELLKDGDEIDASDEYFYEVEDEYVDAVKNAKEWFRIERHIFEIGESKPSAGECNSSSRQKTVVTDTASSSSQEESSVNQGASTASTTSSVDLVGMMNLPKVDLEPFDGDAIKYHTFMSVFDENVDKVLKDGNSKLMRLLQYTKGRANDAIRSCALLNGDEGYKNAREILKRRFGNDHIVTDRIIKQIRTGKPVRSADDLQQLADDLSNCLMTLTRMQTLCEVDSQTCIVEVISRLQPYLKTRWKRHALEVKRTSAKYPSFRDLVEFIGKEADEENDPVYGSIHVRHDRNDKCDRSRDNRHSQNVASFSAGIKQTNGNARKYLCVACKGEHRLLFCDLFRSMKLPQRLGLVKEHKLCENCLIANHTAVECRKPSICTVPGCGRKHTKYIHQDSHRSGGARTDMSRGGNSDTREGRTRVSSNNVNCSAAKCSDGVCVPIVPVVVNQRVSTTALLDTGSTSSFCTRRLVDKLGLVGDSSSYSLSTLSAFNEPKTAEIVKFVLESPDGCESIRLSNVYVVDRIPVQMPRVEVNKYSHLSNIPVFVAGDNVDVLIGQDHSEALIPLETRVGEKSEPFAVRTLLGWSINGPIGSDRVAKHVVSNFVALSDSSLEQSVERLWRLEEEGVNRDELSWSLDDRRVMDLWDAKHEFVDGHYQLPIPWKDGVDFPNSYGLAVSRLGSLKRSLIKKGLLERYDDEISKLLEKGYAEVVPASQFGDSSNIWYLPHHAVISDKRPDKLRVVFDCAAKYHGQSLNDKCLQGPDLNNKLINVLLRFRRHKVAVSSDIESMYYQVKVPLEQRDCLRFLWFDRSGDIVVYRMTSHVFGGVWSGAAAAYALQRTLVDSEGHSEVVEGVLRDAFYVDDCLVSFSDVDSALEAVEGISSLLRDKGFRLTKFVTNDEVVLSHIPDTDRASAVKDLQVTSRSTALGIKWDVWTDQLYFDVGLSAFLFDVTKKKMLSFVSSLFDPLGLISPVLIGGRIIFQDATRLKLGWDEILPVDLIRKWKSWYDSLSQLSVVRVDRCIKPEVFDCGAMELHHFSDASSAAYGCCSYLRAVNAVGEIHVSLLCSKSRICPLKSSTIPRLELQAALLAARVDATLKKELQLDLGQSHFWVDSEIVVKYITNDSKRYQVFVANRVSEIRSLSEPNQWHYVPGSLNPADIVSRGVGPAALVASEWFSGPSFLHTYKSEWNVRSIDDKLDDDDEEVCKSRSIRSREIASCAVSVRPHPLDKLIAHYSSWLKLKRAVGWLIRLRGHLRSKVQKDQSVSLSAGEIRDAEVLILRHVQGKSYQAEMKSLLVGKSVPKSCRLRSLMSVIDHRGLLCVGGRLSAADLPESEKHPCIIPHDSHVAKLIAWDYHNRAHVGVEWTLSLIRKKFWITKSRNLVKQVKRGCIMCKRLYGTPANQLMADLPADRMSVGGPPFSVTGVDCFGPFRVKVKRSEVKRYGCLFTCLTTRAVHLEKLDTMEADSFINGLRRFISRRGTPKKFVSDNGTNFVGAMRELNVQGFCTNRDIDWQFIPPGAPHMGGIWERMVKTVKRVFCAIVGCNTLSDEVLSTLLCEVENMVNSRPITHVSSDPLDPTPLSPNNILLLHAGPASMPGVFDDADMYKKKWRQVQVLAGRFWRRWVKDYLPLLQSRSKWTNIKSNLKRGDVVLVLDEDTPRGLWPLGIIVETKVSSDGLVRSVVVKTKSTQFVRPVTKIVRLESSD